ncbi:Oidioi.mRNA.OKI2018_I69.PAR.g9945.t1.cds [Oikopleura dioica]|uniref:Oidioi.mRNA.OKI2018_I69.PAR.g9945.t1.cds n=1 Tax=Oikopleura dioica TaxID=34765 RepID=A0ABN7RTE6_OIKDI|nr:Oidioi.mRNA.OKI2018_I69.PAR.g9945.t1.cds [Oikopleura dioica]
MGMHSMDHVLVQNGLRTFDNPVLDNLIAVEKDKGAKKNIYISLANPVIQLDEEMLKKIRANIKAGIFGILGSPKVGLVFHGKDVLALIEEEKDVHRSTLFLDFPKRMAKLAFTSLAWRPV